MIILAIARPGDKVRFKGQMRGNSYLNKSLKINRNTNWGLMVDRIYTVTEVIEDFNGNPIYSVSGVSNLYDASCFELIV